MLIVVGVFVAACGGSANDIAADPAPDPAAVDAAPASPAAADDETTAADSPSDLAPFGVVETVGGETLDGEDYAGRSLALWFWAPW
jgi:hypothetical protein